MIMLTRVDKTRKKEEMIMFTRTEIKIIKKNNALAMVAYGLHTRINQSALAMGNGNQTLQPKLSTQANKKFT